MTEGIVFLVAQAINFTLSFFTWMILGRIALALVAGQRQSFFSEVFRRGALPVCFVVRRLTPAAVGDAHIPFLTLPLLIAIRIYLLPYLHVAA